MITCITVYMVKEKCRKSVSLRKFMFFLNALLLIFQSENTLCVYKLYKKII